MTRTRRTRLLLTLGAACIAVAASLLGLAHARAAAPAEPGGPLAPALVLTILNEVEPNNAPAQSRAIGCDDIASGVITPAADIDWWDSTGAAGDLLFAVADASGAGPSNDTLLTVRAQLTTTVIISDDDSGLGNSSAVAGIPLPAGGRIYFVVEENGTNSTISRYELHAAVISPTNFAAEIGPNDFYTQAKAVSAAYMVGSLPGGDPADFYSFPANLGDRIVVIMDDDPDKDGNRFDSNLTLLAADGVTALSLGDNQSANQANATRPITAPAGGTYFVRITDGGVGGTEKDYRLVVLVNGRPVSGQPCFAQLRMTHQSGFDPLLLQGVFTATLENRGNVRGPARMLEQYPQGVNIQSCSFMTSNSGGSITQFTCQTGPNGEGSEFGVDTFRPGGTMTGVVRFAALPLALLTRSPVSQTVPFGGAAGFSVTISNTSLLTLTELHLYDPLLSDCSRAWPFATGFPLNALPPQQSVAYACSRAGITARIESTLVLSVPLLARNFAAGFIAGPNGQVDQEGSSATLLMPAVTSLAANVVEVQVFHNLLPLLLR